MISMACRPLVVYSVMSFRDYLSGILASVGEEEEEQQQPAGGREGSRTREYVIGRRTTGEQDRGHPSRGR